MWFTNAVLVVIFSGKFLRRNCKMVEEITDDIIRMSEKYGRVFELLTHDSKQSAQLELKWSKTHRPCAIWYPDPY